MTTVFTLCANNCLPGAMVLGESLKEHNPGFHFVIGLVDRIPNQLDSAYCAPYELIPVESLGIEGFEEMTRKYSIVELCTAVKPWYFEHLYTRDPQADVVIYMDPDMLVYRDFSSLLDTLGRANLVVTPHSCTYDDSATNIYCELAMLCKGIFNLGFIGTRRSAETTRFLRWWQVRLRDHCRWCPGEGMFFDQLWVALAPLYFEGVFVEKDPGYNMSFWNNFERRLSVKDGRRVVNQTHDLVFYHFSGFNPLKMSEGISRGYPMKSLDEQPELKALYDEYGRMLLDRDLARMKQIPCEFAPAPGKTKPSGIAGIVRTAARSAYRCLPAALKGSIRRAVRFLAEDAHQSE